MGMRLHGSVLWGTVSTYSKTNCGVPGSPCLSKTSETPPYWHATIYTWVVVPYKTLPCHLIHTSTSL